MNPGSLRHRITIQQKTATRDAYGAEVVTWATFATVWADIQPLNGRELFAAQATQSEVTGKVNIRYLSGVTPTMRILHDGKYYDIHAVIDYELRHKEMTLLVSEGLTK